MMDLYHHRNVIKELHEDDLHTNVDEIYQKGKKHFEYEEDEEDENEKVKICHDIFHTRPNLKEISKALLWVSTPPSEIKRNPIGTFCRTFTPQFTSVETSDPTTEFEAGFELPGLGYFFRDRLDYFEKFVQPFEHFQRDPYTKTSFVWTNFGNFFTDVTCSKNISSSFIQNVVDSPKGSLFYATNFSIKLYKPFTITKFKVYRTFHQIVLTGSKGFSNFNKCWGNYVTNNITLKRKTSTSHEWVSKDVVGVSTIHGYLSFPCFSLSFLLQDVETFGCLPKIKYSFDVFSSVPPEMN